MQRQDDKLRHLVAAAQECCYSVHIAALHGDVQRHRALRILGVRRRIVRKQLLDDVRLPVVGRNVQRRPLRLQ